MEILLARQPIFDKSERLAGYRLSYAAGESVPTPSQPSESAASVDQRLLEACLTHGLADVAEGLPAYLQVSPSLLEDGTVRILPAARVVLELAPGTRPDPGLVAACRALAKDGYRFAIDGADAIKAPDLRGIAGVARLDAEHLETATLERSAKLLAQSGLQLLASHVPHRGARDLCVAAGVALFEGYRFTQPEVLTAPSVGINAAHGFRILKLITDTGVSDVALEDAIGTDIGLTFKLLRLVNSAEHGGRDIESIGHAIKLVGRDKLYRWLSLVLVSSVAEAGVDHEIAHLALSRAHFCEHLAPESKAMRARGPLFLVGLFSMLDALVGVPMPVLVQQLELTNDVGEALTSRAGFYGAALSLVESYESGAWAPALERAAQLGVQTKDLRPLYTDSIQWARAQLPA